MKWYDLLFMDRARTGGRLAPGIVLACILFVCRPALALDPALDVNQYAHDVWKIGSRNFSKDLINTIAQTSDGYLWLGTDSGLLRFDGVRTVPWQPPGDQHLPSNQILRLLATRDGTLWFGTDKGLGSWKDGKLTSYPEFAGVRIAKLIEDREGAVWVGGATVRKLCWIHDGIVQCVGENPSFSEGISALYEDSKGNLWVVVPAGLWRWRPGPAQFYPLPRVPNGVQGLAEDDDGALLISMRDGIRRLVDGKMESAYPYPSPARGVEALRLIRDHDGGLWVGTSGRGLVHVRHGRTDIFSKSDGLSSDEILTFFEDREGNLWVATTKGLDRFREFAVATFSGDQGLTNPRVESVLAAGDGSVWIGTDSGLNRWNARLMTTPTFGELNGHLITTLFQDGRGRIWVSTLDGIGYLENGRFSAMRDIPSGRVASITEDKQGNVWIANRDQGLFRFSREGTVQQIPWANLGRGPAINMLADPRQGGLWLGFLDGAIVYFADGQVKTSYATSTGLADNHVNEFWLDADDVLWAATDSGLSRLKNRHLATLTSKNGLPCDTAHWVKEDDTHSVWLQMTCGIVRIARSELDAWAAAVDWDNNPARKIQTTVFDDTDGARDWAGPGGANHPLVAKARDGKLWFRSVNGVSVVDPRHIPFNNLAPPVHVEEIIADQKPYDVNAPLRLPPLVRDLEIKYTALSFVAPEKVRFKYKLEGMDGDWQDAANRREAFYTNLPPRNYRFRVMASNNSGVWNETGASFDFSVAPAYYQTTWFRLSVVAVFLALLAALYKLRLRQIARQFNVRLEERVAERTRIARDFHDTLLQSFQGVLLKLHAVTYLIQDRPEAQKTLENVIEQARKAVTEGRDAVQGLRSSTVVTNDLAPCIRALGEELVASQTGEGCPTFRVNVEGTPRNLEPLLRDEVYKIAIEALRNAFRHAQASNIEVEIQYEERLLRLRIRDDGKGIAPNVIAGKQPSGHYGVAGMRERAKLAGGKLAVLSELDSGTEIELTIPASFAYAKASAARRSQASA